MIELCIPPIPALHFCLLAFKVIAHLAVCKQMQKPKDIMALGITPPEELCLSGVFALPKSRLLSVIRSEGQSSAWDFSQPQLGGAEDWYGIETFFHITSVSLLSHGEQNGKCYLYWQRTSPRYHWKSITPSSGVTHLQLLQLGLAPKLALRYVHRTCAWEPEPKCCMYLLEESALARVCRNVFLCQKLYSTSLNQKFLVAMVATCSKSFYCSLLKSSKGESKHTQQL